MTRTSLFALMAVLIGGVAIFGYNRIPDDQSMSFAEQEIAANAPEVRAESETMGDETLPQSYATQNPEVELQESVPDGFGTVPPRPDILTVEGYDHQRVAFMLQNVDMPVATRNEYLNRLDAAYDDPEALEAVLKQLQAELTSG
ncbi:MAG: hypothetical protein AAFV31_04395 [Pseudomonadota bacterium]